MISVNDFVQKHGSFWRTHFPAMESYVRIINAGGYERYHNGYPQSDNPERNYIISETAFCLVKMGISEEADVDSAYLEASRRLAALPGVPDHTDLLTEEEKQKVSFLSTDLRNMIREIEPSGTPQFDPIFKGYGSLLKGIGDIITGDTLIEVKSVERPFRIYDYRQLVTYFFFSSASGQNSIKKYLFLIR